MIDAVIPMKPFALAKQRLSGVLDDAVRQKLVRTMLADVLCMLRESAAVARRFVVTADPEVAEFAVRYGAELIPENDTTGLNGAIAAASRYLEARNVMAMLVLPGDVPLATPGEISALVSLVQGRGAGIVPAHDLDGTNALVLSPPSAFSTAFGEGSYQRHVAAARAAGLPPVTRRFEGLGRDIDMPDHLHDLARHSSGRKAYDFLRKTLEKSGYKEPQDA